MAKQDPHKWQQISEIRIEFDFSLLFNRDFDRRTQ